MKKQHAAAVHEPPKKPVSRPSKVAIQKIPTGVRGLDDILGGGIPEFSFNVIAGAPGCGKTTLAHQIIFANATVKKPALYFTVLGEPALKMLRYQQQFAFFDAAKIGKAIRFINVSDLVINKDLEAVLAEIIKQVTAANPGVVVVDSFRTVMRRAAATVGEIEMQSFIQKLTQFLTGWEATTFLVGEYGDEETRGNPLFTIADGLFWLSQKVERNSVVRKLQILKVRGQGSVPGLHTVRINDGGLQAFPRTLGFDAKKVNPARRKRLSMGIAELDKMMGGGVLEGDSLLIAGPSGTGKTALATQFIAAGLRNGEPAIIAIFEERPKGYTDRADSLGLNLKTPQDQGKLEILYLRPLDLSVDETMQEILDAVERVGAKRLVIDSLVSLEMALAPGFREDFRESLYRLIVALTGAGVTILSTVEVEDTFNDFSFSHYMISFLTDDILRLRYVEIEGQLRKVIVVIKMRGGNHSKDIREYVITDKGVVVIKPHTTEYVGLTTGVPQRTGPSPVQKKRISAGTEGEEVSNRLPPIGRARRFPRAASRCSYGRSPLVEDQQPVEPSLKEMGHVSTKDQRPSTQGQRHGVSPSTLKWGTEQKSTRYLSYIAKMLHEFLTSHRIELIKRCQAKVAMRTASTRPAAVFDHGVPLFLQQLADTLRAEELTAARDATGPEAAPAHTEIGHAAALHGVELHRLGCSVGQVVHEYGDVCQAVTDMAVEKYSTISTDEFRTLNRCLDNAIADAVTSFAEARRLSEVRIPT